MDLNLHKIVFYWVDFREILFTFILDFFNVHTFKTLMWVKLYARWMTFFKVIFQHLSSTDATYVAIYWNWSQFIQQTMKISCWLTYLCPRLNSGDNIDMSFFESDGYKYTGDPSLFPLIARFWQNIRQILSYWVMNATTVLSLLSCLFKLHCKCELIHNFTRINLLYYLVW